MGALRTGRTFVSRIKGRVERCGEEEAEGEGGGALIRKAQRGILSPM